MQKMKNSVSRFAATRVLDRKQKFQGWKTTDEEELERRRLRAVAEPMHVKPVEPGHAFYGSFACHSEGSGRTYLVEIRSLTQLENSCQCADYLTNGLGTCKHIEAVLARLAGGGSRAFEKAAREGSPRVEVYLSRRGTPEIKVAWSSKASRAVRGLLSPFFSNDDALLADPVEGFPALRRALAHAPAAAQNEVHIGAEVEGWIADITRRKARLQAKNAFLSDIREEKRDMDFLKFPLYPYQKDGVLFLSFGERVLLADDMGLGKTVQAIGACELLRRLRRIERVLVVSPASLKAEWEEQIAKFTGLPVKMIWGPRGTRLKMYREPSFFYLTNYEQIRSDHEAIMEILAPDVVILDEAQRIKNWHTKTARSAKRLSSPYAFVLTGTPLENRIDEIYSIIEFLDPSVFGPLFRFNREFYDLDEKGHPAGYKDLEELHRRIRPVMLRRLKEEVEDQLPARTVNNYFVGMEPEQRSRYEEYRDRVARLLAATKHRPMTKEEFEKLQKWLACMRMLCDTPYILDHECRICPKLPELSSLLEDLAGADGNKVLIFSEWERMLLLVKELAEEMGFSYAWHTGSVPQQKRRQEIRRFKADPDCRIFLSTDSGSVGLNLQEASAVINMDLPWNPAKLEQRIARAWRKHQTRSVRVVNLVCENSIEHRMLGILSQKKQLAESILDGRGDFKSIKMPSGRAAFMERLEALMGKDVRRVLPSGDGQPEPEKIAARDPYQAFHEDMIARLADRLLLLESCRGSAGRPMILAVVNGDSEPFRPVAERLLRESFMTSEVPLLELLDRATYETIQRLVTTGFLKSDKKDVRQLHCSPAVSPVESVKNRFLGKAKETFAGAERKMQMATVLAGGGFPVEALSPVHEAVELSLKASAYLAGEDVAGDGGDEAVSLSLVESRMVPEGLLPENGLTIVAMVRESSHGSASPEEDGARTLIQEGRKLVDHVNRVLHELALG